MKVFKQILDEDIIKLKNTFLKRSQIKTMITKDTTAFTEDGKLLFIFKKRKIIHSHSFFDAVVPFIKKNPTSNRGSSTGSTTKNVSSNPKVFSAIIGYFDRFSPRQKSIFKKNNLPMPLEVRATRYIQLHPNLYKSSVVPFVSQIDALYKKYLPIYYNKQSTKAKEMHFKIGDTAFTTITVNLNYQTTIHVDSGDDIEGFGNLTVIENGTYTGGETCFPQYGIGIDVRQGDVLFMDVHQWHANLPLKFSAGAERLSIVCYLRKKLWERTRRKSLRFMHNRTKKLGPNLSGFI